MSATLVERRVHQVAPHPSRRVGDVKAPDRWPTILRILTGLMAAAALAISAIWIADLFNEPPYDPVTYDNPWLVVGTDALGRVRVPQVPGYDAPSIRTSDVLPVQGTRCNDSSEHAALVTSWWERTDGVAHRFTHVVPDTGEAVVDQPIVIEAGCNTLRFTVTPPPDLVAQVERDGVQSWKFVGATIAERPNAVAAAFETEAVFIVPVGE